MQNDELHGKWQRRTLRNVKEYNWLQLCMTLKKSEWSISPGPSTNQLSCGYFPSLSVGWTEVRLSSFLGVFRPLCQVPDPSAPSLEYQLIRQLLSLSHFLGGGRYRNSSVIISISGRQEGQVTKTGLWLHSQIVFYSCSQFSMGSPLN